MKEQLKSYLLTILDSGLLDNDTVEAMNNMCAKEAEMLRLGRYFDNKELIYEVSDDNDMFPYMNINKDIDENTAYLLVSTLFTNAKELHVVHPSAKQLLPENGVKTAAPLHPGAEKYFKEMGLL